MESLKNWIMIVLTLLFVLLYIVALLGWLKPVSDVTIVMRLEPILFVIIGYYFGRQPAIQSHQTLKEEITRQTQKGEAAQDALKLAQQEREALAEKLKNVSILMSAVSKRLSKTLIDISFKTDKEKSLEPLRYLINAASNILNS